MEHFPPYLFKPTISWDIPLHVLGAPWSLSVGLVIMYNSYSKRLDVAIYSISKDLGWPARRPKILESQSYIQIEPRFIELVTSYPS